MKLKNFQREKESMVEMAEREETPEKPKKKPPALSNHSSLMIASRIMKMPQTNQSSEWLKEPPWISPTECKTLRETMKELSLRALLQPCHEASPWNTTMVNPFSTKFQLRVTTKELTLNPALEPLTDPNPWGTEVRRCYSPSRQNLNPWEMRLDSVH